MSDFSKIAFSSAFRYEHIVLKGSSPFSVGGGGFANTTVTIIHNLGYRPFIKAFYSYGDGKYFSLFSGPSSFDIDVNGGQISNVNADSSNFIVFIENFDIPPISGTIYYRIYAEPQV